MLHTFTMIVSRILFGRMEPQNRYCTSNRPSLKILIENYFKCGNNYKNKINRFILILTMQNLKNIFNIKTSIT